VRRHGFDYYVDLDILVDGDLTVREGHDLAHAVHERVRDELPLIAKVMVHVEPDDEYGRFALPGETAPPA
jgi:divalent metal cation (Fe/Co/Zn/Cd) transporter